MQQPLTTEALAAALGLKPQTIRAALSRDGHYCGIRPTKAPNRFLYWPADAVERITGQPRPTDRQPATA